MNEPKPLPGGPDLARGHRRSSSDSPAGSGWGAWLADGSLGLLGAARRSLLWLASGRVWDPWCFGVGYAILLPFLLAPLFATRLLPGLDLPFHIAAADMLAKAGDPASPYAPYYEGGLRLAPYAAHFLALDVLGKVMGLLVAHKLIIALYIAGLPLAMASLLAACGRSRVPALLAFPLAYNLTLHYGFVSFALSLPVVLLLLASMAKLALTRGRRLVMLWWSVTAVVAFLLYLCHLQNFLYGICAALAFAVLVPATWRRKLVATAALAPSVALLALWQITTAPVAGQAPLTLAVAWHILKRHRLSDLGHRPLRVDIWQRILLLPMHAMRGFVDGVNLPACRALCFIAGAFFVVGLVAGLLYWAGLLGPQTSRGVRSRSITAAVVIAFLGALTAYIALPHHLQEMELMTFFPRFSVLVLLMLLLLVPAGLLRLRGPLAWLLPVPALVLGISYGRQLFLHYRAYAGEVAGFVDLAERVAPGGKAIGLMFDRKSKVMSVESAMVGIPDFYPALRPAPGSMAPPAYCGLRHMPCRVKLGRNFITSPWVPASFAPASMLEIFDYVFTRGLPPGLDLFRGYHGMVELVGTAPPWALFRRRPGKLVPDPAPPPGILPMAAKAAAIGAPGSGPQVPSQRAH